VPSRPLPTCLIPSLVVQELPMEQLGDIKAKSIVEWIATERVRRAIIRHFRHFLMSYVDGHGNSVYGERIRNLGESMFLPLSTISLRLIMFYFSTSRQLRVIRSILHSPCRRKANLGLFFDQLASTYVNNL
jgi:hypothetical protein